MAAQLSKWKKARAGMETIFKLRHASFLQDYDGKPDWCGIFSDFQIVWDAIAVAPHGCT